MGARYSSYMIANKTPPEIGRKQSPFYYANGVYEPDPKKGVTGMTLLCSAQATAREDKKGWINCACSTHFQGGFSHHGGLRVVRPFHRVSTAEVVAFYHPALGHL